MGIDSDESSHISETHPPNMSPHVKLMISSLNNIPTNEMHHEPMLWSIQVRVRGITKEIICGLTFARNITTCLLKVP